MDLVGWTGLGHLTAYILFPFLLFVDKDVRRFRDFTLYRSFTGSFADVY